MEPAENAAVAGKCYKTTFKQPVTCPWSNFQPYPPSASKNRAGDLSANQTSSSDKQMYPDPKLMPKTCPSLQQSSSQFFYFLRLMQLFPETHPATLHTVLSLCKNDFFCAVDKLLYARRCKTLYNRSHKRYCCSYSEPYRRRERVVDLQVQQDKSRVPESVSVPVLFSKDDANREPLLDLTMKSESKLEEYGENEISLAHVEIFKEESEQETQTGNTHQDNPSRKGNSS
nr:uncharacterized protein LOC111513599 [Leptinotarsa decemlineata]